MLPNVFLAVDSDPFAPASNGMLGILHGFAGVLKIVIIIGALITLVMLVLKIMSGDKESASKLGWWTVGLSLGFILLHILDSLKY